MKVQHGYYKKRKNSLKQCKHILPSLWDFESHSAVNHSHYFGHIFKQPKLFPQWQPNSMSSKPLKTV